MDANGTPYHLLAGRADWRPLLEGAAGLSWDSDDSGVTLRPLLPPLRRRADGTELEIADRRGADRDRYGAFYWISEDHREIRLLPGAATGASAQAGSFWSLEQLERPPEPRPGADFVPCAPPPLPELPTLWGLAVTESHYLVVGTRDPGGLLTFDLHGGGPPVWSPWPPEVDFRPFDFAGSRDGGLWILDLPLAAPPRLWRLDAHLRIDPTLAPPLELAPARIPDFEDPAATASPAPADCVGEPRIFPLGVELGVDLAAGSPPLSVLEDPHGLVELPDGSVLVLDNPPGATFSVLHRFRDGLPVGVPVSLEGILDEVVDPAATVLDTDLRGQDLAFVPTPERGVDDPEGALYVASQAEGQSFVFALFLDPLSFELVVCPRYLPMRRFGGKALVEACGEVFYDFEERWLPLVEHPRRRYETEGRVESIVLDGKTPRCRWHRLLFDGCVPDGASVSVESRAAERESLLAEQEWTLEPAPILRASGSELPFADPLRGCRPVEGAGTWELLFQRARGRFLELRVRLAGDGRNSPRIRALRVYYPRFSYLDEYLPAVYREDAESASFLDRFLANAEGLFTALEGRIAAAQALFDERTAPAEYLDWLAGWLGATLEEEWEDSRRRLFLAHAHELYRWRGTPSGLLAWIRLALDPCPGDEIFAALGRGERTACGGGDGASLRPFDHRLVEHFVARGLPPIAASDPSELVGPALTSVASVWKTSDGAAAFEARYRDHLKAFYGASSAGDDAALQALDEAWETEHADWNAVVFSALTPEHQRRRDDRRGFLDRQPGLVYADVGDEEAADLEAWRLFLAQRHRTVDALNRAHQLGAGAAWIAFDQVTLPVRLPAVAAALVDWIDFVSLAVPIEQTANRFTVLVPTTPGEPLEERRLKLERARLVVEREKPAHTEFDVEPFWALFRVGAARLGFDTVLGEGSRFVSLVLGQGALTSSRLAESHPWNVRDRWLVGRDAPRENRP